MSFPLKRPRCTKTPPQRASNGVRTSAHPRAQGIKPPGWALGPARLRASIGSTPACYYSAMPWDNTIIIYHTPMAKPWVNHTDRRKWRILESTRSWTVTAVFGGGSAGGGRLGGNKYKNIWPRCGALRLVSSHPNVPRLQCDCMSNATSLTPHTKHPTRHMKGVGPCFVRDETQP
jgi:hypothetical protein